MSRRSDGGGRRRRAWGSLTCALLAAAGCADDSGSRYATVADLARAAGCHDLSEITPEGRNACSVDGPEYEFVVGHPSRMKALEPVFDAYCSTKDTAAGAPEFAYIRGANWLIFTGEDFGSRDALKRIAERTGGRVVSPC